MLRQFFRAVHSTDLQEDVTLNMETRIASTSSNRDVRRDDLAHVLHTWSAQKHINPLPVASGTGAFFQDFDGNRYLDFTSQLVNLNLGHQHPVLVDAIATQARQLATISPRHANDVRAQAARLITEVAPGHMSKVFFTNGGAEANENAMRMARHYTGRNKVLASYRSYHGATADAIAATGDPRRYAAGAGSSEVVHFWGPYPYRSAFHAQTVEEESERALKSLREVITVEGPATIAAILLETVVGTNGILVPPPGYLEGVRALCDEFGIVFIADEVMAGFGRCGEWFAADHWGVAPDLITFAKGVNSGYVPLGGVIISDAIAERFDDRVYPGGLTYSGHPLACAVAVASFGVFRDEDIIAHVRTLATDVVKPGLQDLMERHPSVGDVRGLGLFWAIELVKDRQTREPLVPFNANGRDAAPMTAFADACKTRGLWPFTHFNRTHVVPPLVISAEELRQGLAILDEALDVADSCYTGADA